MDFHAAMETFAEAWVAANTPTAVNVESHTHKQHCYQPDESQMSGVRSHGQGPQVGMAGHGSGMVLERAGSVINRPAHGLGHGVDTSLKQPEQSSVAPAGSTKSLPIHCVVEQISGTPSFDSVSSVACAQNAVELDSYAILPSSTLLSDLVHSALIKLGYSSINAMTAKGAIQIKNWKPLTFDAITNNPQASIDDILSELTNVATLRIRIASHPKPSTAEEVKEKLLQLLLSQSHSLLNQSGCPINQGLLSSISKGDHSVNIPEDLTSAFDKWYKEQLKGQLCKNVSDLVPREKTPEPDIKEGELSKESSPQTSPDLKDGSAPTAPQPYFMASRTRVRTSFDPEHEIPRLHKWFQENQHPSREQMIRFMNELNQLDSRKGRRPLDLTNIIYWFKNARAAQRRASKAVDDSFENEENTEVTTSSLLSGHYPYLPNKNAVYVIPFPYHPQLGEHDAGNDQPCDLSMNKKKDIMNDRPAEKLLDSKQHNCDEMKPVNMSNGYESDRKRPTTPLVDMEIKQEESADEVNVEESESEVLHREVFENGTSDCCEKVEDKPVVTDRSVASVQDRQKDEEDKRLFYDDSSEDISESESDDDDHSALVQKENIDHAMMSTRCDISSANMSAAASMAAMSLAQMAQPLHIPQLNPPLMTYYPMNARFYSPHSNSVHESVHTNSHKHHEPRKRRTRVFIDPLTEIPKLEKWFLEDTHPSAYMIDKFCDELNRSEYRQKFPRLESKNVQLWFKNHRAKVKRMRLDTSS
ncbi:uncharacterized protein LOC121377339 [Gigantopelta aegis]|uniref:uncharacterized protein LOC121377339 n=1 Tax=Gigantopelta aegis TaxID=1735272 RepID=UPI001B88C114|nr:uncharacterized protein LOC121377339 [Gigantopelta aegis]